MNTEIVDNKSDITVEQNTELRRLGGTLRYFLIANVVLVLVLTFGFVFPTKIDGQALGQSSVASAADYQGKSSPLDIPREAKPEPKAQVPKYSARTYPLPVAMPINASLTLTEPPQPNVVSKPTAVSPADAEADLTMRKRTT